MMTSLSGVESPAFMDSTLLSVNVNKIALLRNSRHQEMPDIVRLTEIALEAGADGITVHPRPDGRHIRPADVRKLSAVMRRWPGKEFNIEGNPLLNLMDYVRELRPHQCTFVPDSEGQFTSDHGWRFPRDLDRLKPLIEEAHSLGVRVSLFMDPDLSEMQWVYKAGADRIELYTETYARAHGSLIQRTVAMRFRNVAEAAVRMGLGVNAGHDLNRTNLEDFLRAVPQVHEVSIGHALVSDAVEFGLGEAVRRYKHCIGSARRRQGHPECFST